MRKGYWFVSTDNRSYSITHLNPTGCQRLSHVDSTAPVPWWLVHPLEMRDPRPRHTKDVKTGRFALLNWVLGINELGNRLVARSQYDGNCARIVSVAWHPKTVGRRSFVCSARCFKTFEAGYEIFEPGYGIFEPGYGIFEPGYEFSTPS